MKILNTEVEFDFFDAEQMKKLEINMEEINKEINNMKLEKKKQSQFINEFCEIIENGFDSIFGNGISKLIFKKKRNFKLYVQAFRDLVKAREQQEKEVTQSIQNLQKEIHAISFNYSTERIE